MSDNLASANIDGDWRTISELTQQYKVLQPTIWRYIERHGHHLKVKKIGKTFQIHEELLLVFERIPELYLVGMNGERVEFILAEGRSPIHITVEETERVITVEAAIGMLAKRMAEGAARAI